MSRRLARTLALVLLAGCSRVGGEPKRDARSAPLASAPARKTAAAAEPAPVPAPSSSPAPSAARSPPWQPPPGDVFVELPVDGDRPVQVAHAPRELTRAIVYLHGVCGDVFAVRDWLGSATRFATLIGLTGEKPCGAGRRSWAATTEQLHARIRRALAAVAEARAGALDSARVILMGYSQGATRAELLHVRYPELYPWLVLGGAPERPSPAELGQARRIAVLGGERDATAHLRAGVAALEKAGKAARFFVLPGAGHGEYGPEAARVMADVLAWISEDAR